MVTDKTSRSCWRVNNGFWWFLGRDACREDKHNEAPEGSGRGQEGSGRHREGQALVYPPVMPCFFRDACLAWGIYHPRKRRSFTPPLY